MRMARRDDVRDGGQWPPDSFLGRLRNTEREALLALGGLANYGPRERLIVEGDEGGSVTFVFSGQVKVVVHDDQGHEHLLGIRNKGSMLGELSYTDGRPRSASVIAMTQVRATNVSRERFDSYLKGHPGLALELARVVARRLRDSDESHRQIRGQAVPVRVARTLYALAEDSDGLPVGPGAVIKLSQGELAQLVHAAEITVNRTLAGFRDRRFVLTARRRIIVPCLECLGRLATALSADPEQGENHILGCGGVGSHSSS